MGCHRDEGVVDQAGAGLLEGLLSGYLIRFVNVPLLAAGRSLTDLEWAELCARWHQVNAVRVVLVGVALALQPSQCQFGFRDGARLLGRSTRRGAGRRACVVQCRAPDTSVGGRRPG